MRFDVRDIYASRVCLPQSAIAFAVSVDVIASISLKVR
jgi:hypothetical protein